MYQFHGKWMCDPRFADCSPIPTITKEPQAPHPEELKNLHMLVRKSFTVPAFQSARLEISADDFYKLKVNGKLAGQGPAQGYPFAYYRNSIDLTPYLNTGENLLELDVYYQGLKNFAICSGDMRMGFICDLYIDDTLFLSSDESFEYAISEAYPTKRTVGYDTQFLEDFDSRLEQPTRYYPCAAKKDPDYQFMDKPAVMIALEPLTPKETKTFNGGLFFDFGTEFVGTLNVTAKGKAGQTVRILCGEEDAPEAPFVRYDERCNCKYEEFWTLKDGESRLEQYDYKAFRYAALTFPEDVEILSVQAIARHFPFDDDAFRLETNDEILAGIISLCKNTMKYALQEVFVDCPGREKGQYAGDLTISGPVHCWTSRDLRLFRKAIENQMQSAFYTKALLGITPCNSRHDIADYSLQFPLLALSYYRFTKDKAFLQTCYETCLGIEEYFDAFAREDGLLETVNTTWNLVDWPRNLRDGYDFPLTIPIGEGCHNVINAFYVGFTHNLDEIRQILGLPTTDKAKKLTQAFNANFFDYEAGFYTDCAETKHGAIQSNILPLFYGLCPEGYSNKVADFIEDKGMRCGVYMAYFFLKALCRAGRYESAYKLITSTGENSWYNMIREGATTTLEAWGKDKKDNCSMCHPWACGPVAVLLEDFLEMSFDGTLGQNHLPEGVWVKVQLKDFIQ